MPKQDDKPAPAATAALLLAAAALFWSGNHIVGRAIAGHVPPVGISMLRWLVPAIVLWPFARPYVARDWPVIRAHPWLIIWFGVVGGALFSALQYVGLQYTTALNVSVLNSLVPVLIVAAGTALFRDSMRPIQLAGIAVSLAGVLVIVSRGSVETLTSLSFSRGDIIIVVNMAAFSIYAVTLRLRPKIHWVSFLFMLGVVSAAASLPFAIWEWASGITFRPTLLTAASIAYVSIFPSVLGFAAWNRGVELMGANRAGPFLHLIPVFTAIFGYAVLGETIAAYQLAGFAAILLGIWLASAPAAK